MFFSFQYITSDKHYNIEYLKKNRGGKENEIYFALLHSLQQYSQSTWNDLKLKRKQAGGYETIAYSEMKRVLPISFQRISKYRMIQNYMYFVLEAIIE